MQTEHDKQSAQALKYQKMLDKSRTRQKKMRHAKKREGNLQITLWVNAELHRALRQQNLCPTIAYIPKDLEIQGALSYAVTTTLRNSGRINHCFDDVTMQPAQEHSADTDPFS